MSARDVAESVARAGRLASNAGPMAVHPVSRRTRLRWALLALAAVCLLFGLAPARAEGRVALLIANANYKVGPLRNPPNDVREMKAALEAVGFKVQPLVLDANQAAMKRAVRDFGKLAEGADVAFLYYSGHATQANGENYLIPLGATIEKEADYEVEAVSANALMSQIGQARPRAAIVVLDACRDNPFAAFTKSSTKGLGRMAAPTGTMIAFATAPNTTAGDEGYYARALAAQIRRPEVELLDVFRDAAAEVLRLTGGKQDPRISEVSINERIYLAGRNVGAAPAAAPAGGQDAGAKGMPLAEIAAGAALKDCDDCPALVVLPTGSFRMGSPDSEKNRSSNEGPVHEVRIGYRLAVGRSEVTRGEFGRFVAAVGYRTEAERGQGCLTWNGNRWENSTDRNWRNPGYTQTDSHPAVCVSWNDAQAYLEWLNKKAPGKDFRLLSEAEWEYAARAGQAPARFPWGDDANTSEICTWANGADAAAKSQVIGTEGWIVANCNDDHAHTAPADALRPNAFGLHHMHGNVWEWVQDVWHDNYSGAPTEGRAWITGGDQTRRVLRGGSWGNEPKLLRSANRTRLAPGVAGDGMGFRIARPL